MNRNRYHAIYDNGNAFVSIYYFSEHRANSKQNKIDALTEKGIQRTKDNIYRIKYTEIFNEDVGY